MESQNEHRRRVRYSGTHPRHYSEKYKELQPEKYGDTIEKVIRKGKTPAGMHISICVQEILDILKIQPGQIGLDATLGYGGHTLAMLKCLNLQGHIYGLDIDPVESEKTRKRLEDLGYGPEILTVIHSNFSQIDAISSQHGPFHFVLADLGVSSMQIDNPERGFSYKFDGPLDLRLNPQQGITAARRLETISQDELEGMLLENSDEPYAREIARAIISTRKKGCPIETTAKLRQAIEKALSSLPAATQKEAVKKSCARTFQALRIDINHEFEVLYQFLEKLPHTLAPGGRVAILTFHSGEDRLVKQSFKEYKKAGLYAAIADEVIRPGARECALNSRAKSAKLRWAVRG
ncbi:MAG: 16S rRNA (cytosine(1402)-N(4))-methyltransferase RsmH [Hungatella sp.]|nr:16S rRNA (cytosine(1402)-N(4))-methyltransferase RsmH [Hungatella sp.]